MPLTFYTVLCEEDGAAGYPVKYIKPQEPHNPASYYGRVQTFTIPKRTFDDPGEASQEFKACVGGQNACYLPPAQFRQKVKKLHAMSTKTEHKLQQWLKKLAK